jgi:drug/metabolite transporter (DMT)-like permease
MWSPPPSAIALLAVLYLGWIITGLGNYLQTIGQQSISAERAAVIYSMDPLYAGNILYNILYSI